MKSVFERVRYQIVDNLGIDDEKVVPEAALVADLDADSLDMVEVMMALEEEFEIDVSDEEAEKIATVQDILDLLVKHGIKDSVQASV